MGVVRITENLGEGRYLVSVEKNVERAKALKALLEKQIEKLKAEIKELKKKLPELENKIDDKRIELVLARQKFIDDTDNVAFLETQLNTLNQTIEQLEKRLKAEKETKAAVDKLIDSGNISTNTTLGGSPIINDLGCSLSATRRATKANIKDKLTPTAEGPPVGELVANGKGRKCAALAFNFREITTAEILATRQATKGKFKEYNISPGVSTEIGLEAYSRRTKMVAKGEVFPAQPKISKKEFLAGDLTTVRTQIKGVFKTEKLFTEEPTEGELKAYRKGMKPLVTIINAGINIDGKVEATRKATKGKFKDAAPPEAARPSSEILATRKGTDAAITCELVLKTQPQAEDYFQAVSDSKQDVIDGLNQRLTELTQEKNEILNQIKDLRDPTDLIKEYEQILAEMSEVVLKKQGLDNDIRKSEITLDKKEKLQRDYNETITQPDNRPAWCVDYAVDLDSSTEAIENRLTEIQNNINALLQDNINLTTEINAQIAGGIPEDADIIKQAKAAIKGNLDTIDSLKEQKKVAENGLLKVSVDINDENELILIGPYTYEPIQKDVEEKEDYIAGKLEEKDKLDFDDNILFNVITGKQNEVDAKYAEINGLSLQIAAIDVSNNPEEQAQRRINLQEQIDKLREEIHRLSKDIIKLKREKEKNRAKAAALTKVILRLNSELEQIKVALASADKILLPQVNDKTRRFQPTQSSSPEAVFFNKSLLPGFQKWKPTFRLGVIKAMQANDLCTVELVEARSSQQNLNINRQKILENVRIKYGSCNSAAFNVGDRVVVEFSEREQDRPTVIGFEDNPRPCGGVVCLPSSDLAPNGWGLPITDANKPLGTPGGEKAKATLRFGKTQNGYNPAISRHVDMRGGCCVWTGDGGKVLTWHGPFGNAVAPLVSIRDTSDYFYRNRPFFGYLSQTTYIQNSARKEWHLIALQRFGTAIYEGGRQRYGHSSIVLGAGRLGKYIVFVAYVDTLKDAIYYLNDSNHPVFLGYVELKEPGYIYAERTNIYSFSSNGKKATTLYHATINVPDAELDIFFNMYVTIPRITLDLDQNNNPVLIGISYDSRLNDFLIQRSGTNTFIFDDDGFGSTQTSSFSASLTNSSRIVAIGYKNNDEVIVEENISYSESGSSNKVSEDVNTYVFTTNSSKSVTQTFKAGNDILFSTSSSESLSVYDVNASAAGDIATSSEDTENGVLGYYSFHNEGWWVGFIYRYTGGTGLGFGTVRRYYQIKGHSRELIVTE